MSIDLMKRRVKLLNGYPRCPYKVGEIFIQTYHPDGETWYWKCSLFSDNDMVQGWPEKFPHLFKELAWWEERKPEEMPEYVEDSNGVISKVERWQPPMEIEDGMSNMRMITATNNWQVISNVMCHFQPTDYTQYLNSKKDLK